MKQFPIKKILILVTILAVPGFLYYLLQEKGKNRYKPLTVYGPKEVAKTFHYVRGVQTPDTIYYQIPDFNLLNQHGAEVAWKNYAGKIILLNLFHASNNSDPAMEAMKEFDRIYARNTMFHLMSVTVNPMQDSSAVLLDYAKHLDANGSKWDFLTGDTSQVYQLIKKGLFLDAVKTNENGTSKFNYSNMFVLLDSQHRIRGYYEASHKEALSKLDDEIKVLIAEELRNMRDGR